jgi:hypothetical protein
LNKRAERNASICLPSDRSDRRVTPPATRTAPSRADAEAAVARLQELSAETRGAAILDSSGGVLAATGPPERWAGPAREVLAAGDAAAGEPALHVHVGTEDGEVFAVRHEGLAAIAVADRFSLASLMTSDLRAVLRELARGQFAGAEEAA